MRGKINNSCVTYQDNLILTGDVEGYYKAGSITLDSANVIGDMFIEASTVDIVNTDIIPVFEIKSIGCSQ
jgi:hypothetical protein